MAQASDVRFTRFSLWGGALIFAAATLLLLHNQKQYLLVGQSLVFSLSSATTVIATDALLAAGFVVTAYGRRRGAHLTGHRRLDAASLAFFGAGRLIEFSTSLITNGADTVEYVVLATIQVVALLAGFNAAAAAYRSGVADKSTRLLLIATTLVFAIFTTLALTPSFAAMSIAAPVYALFPLSLIAFAISLLLDGRHELLREQARDIYRQW